MAFLYIFNIILTAPSMRVSEQTNSNRKIEKQTTPCSQLIINTLQRQVFYLLIVGLLLGKSYSITS